MSNTYAIVVNPDMDVDTLRVENIDKKDNRVGIHNICDWLGSTEIGRYEFAIDTALWFTNTTENLNIVGTGLLGNRKALYGNVVITTWTKRGIDTEGIPETRLPEVWSWIEEVISYNKMYMETHDMTLPQLRRFIEEGI